MSRLLASDLIKESLIKKNYDVIYPQQVPCNVFNSVDLYIKTKMHDITITNYVVFSFQA